MSSYKNISAKHIPNRKIIQSEIDDLLDGLSKDKTLDSSVINYAEKELESLLLDYKEIHRAYKLEMNENKKNTNAEYVSDLESVKLYHLDVWKKINSIKNKAKKI